MPITRDFVKSLPEGPKKEHYKYILNDYMRNDEWAIKATKNVGVVLTSHPGNRPFLKASVESHFKLGYWLTLVYDNYFDPTKKGIKYDSIMPQRDVFDKLNTFLIGPHQTWGGVLYPYFWLLKLGLETMGCFEYVFCSNGDCVLEKPENFTQILEMIGDADIMGCGWEVQGNNGRELFNTTSFLAKTTAARAIMKHFQDHLIPFDNYEKYSEKYGNTESRFAMAIRELGLKVKIVDENPYDTQLSKPHGTWNKILGFRHIHGEYNRALKRKELPPEPHFLDDRYITSQINMIKKYYETKDKKYLKKWWSMRRK